MKTSTITASMSPILALIIAKVLDYISDHADEIISAIKDKFLSKENPDSEVAAAIQTLGYDPSHETLAKLSDVLEAKGHSADQLASLLVTKTVV